MNEKATTKYEDALSSYIRSNGVNCADATTRIVWGASWLATSTNYDGKVLHVSQTNVGGPATVAIVTDCRSYLQQLLLPDALAMLDLAIELQP